MEHDTQVIADDYSFTMTNEESSRVRLELAEEVEKQQTKKKR